MDKKYIDADFLKQKISREWDMQELYLPVHFFEAIDDLPAADVQEVRHGYWKKRMSTLSSVKCSKCGNSHEYDTTYCPNCGARMGENIHDNPEMIGGEQ